MFYVRKCRTIQNQVDILIYYRINYEEMAFASANIPLEKVDNPKLRTFINTRKERSHSPEKNTVMDKSTVTHRVWELGEDVKVVLADRVYLQAENYSTVLEYHSE